MSSTHPALLPRLVVSLSHAYLFVLSPSLNEYRAQGSWPFCTPPCPAVAWPIRAAYARATPWAAFGGRRITAGNMRSCYFAQRFGPRYPRWRDDI